MANFQSSCNWGLTTPNECTFYLMLALLSKIIFHRNIMFNKLLEEPTVISFTFEKQSPSYWVR